MVTISCPGSINIMGEHALIRGGLGIRLAINRFVSVTAEKSPSQDIEIYSRLGDFKGSLENLRTTNLFPFIQYALEHFSIDGGIKISIKDDLPSDVGLGSSAAVTTALVKSMTDLYGIHIEPAGLVNLIKGIVRDAQNGIGSGIDVAASVYGGMVLYNPVNESVKNLPVPPDMLVLYSGKKIPTAQVVQHVNNQNPPDALFDEMKRITSEAYKHAEQKNWSLFGKSMLAYHDCMKILKLNTQRLDDLQSLLCKTDGVYGAKIAGAGLGDSIIAICAQGTSEAFGEHTSRVEVEPFEYAC